jgi:hypothetical protein
VTTPTTDEQSATARSLAQRTRWLAASGSTRASRQARAERRAELQMDAAGLRPGLCLMSTPQLQRQGRQWQLPKRLAAQTHELPPGSDLSWHLRRQVRGLFSLASVPRVHQDPAAARAGRFSIYPQSRTLPIVTLLVRCRTAASGASAANRARHGRRVRRAWAPLGLGATGEAR